MSNQKQQQQPLLTPTSVALSLSPPRVPPHGSVLRKLYTHPGTAHRYLMVHRDGTHHHEQHDRLLALYRQGKRNKYTNENNYQSHTLASRIHQLTPRNTSSIFAQANPHLPTSLSIPDQMTRYLGALLPLETQHSFRDNGYFKSVADTMVKLTCPLVGLGHWTEVKEFVELSRDPDNNDAVIRRRISRQEEGSLLGNDASKEEQEEQETSRAVNIKGRRRRWSRERIQYGDHAMQYIDLFLPSYHQRNGRIPVRGTLFFVHGGAWGSGQPWMYRLVAPTFLKLNFVVVIAGYRTYPDAATIDEQCNDVKLAWELYDQVLDEFVMPLRNDGGGVNNENGWVGNVVMGHSSGAHVALLMLVDWIGEQLRAKKSNNNNNSNREPNNTDGRYVLSPDYFVGLSGPYDISYHFDYEAGRGVEQISPMKPICGHTRENFHLANPVKRLLGLLGKQSEDLCDINSSVSIQQLAPPILLVHGNEDSTVPFTATSDAARLLRSIGLKTCDEIYLDGTGHQDVIMHFMVGGKAKDLVLNWLFAQSGDKDRGGIVDGVRTEGSGESSTIRSRL